MNTISRLLSLSAVVALASFNAHADEADASQYALKFDTHRTRAEVAAEAATVVKTRSVHPAGSLALAYRSTVDRATVRAALAEAMHKGEVSSGEF